MEVGDHGIDDASVTGGSGVMINIDGGYVHGDLS
jgi:hypothetical protein